MLIVSGVCRPIVARHVAILLAAKHLNLLSSLYSSVDVFGPLTKPFEPFVDFVGQNDTEAVVSAALGVAYIISLPHTRRFRRNASVATLIHEKRRVPLDVAVQFIVHHFTNSNDDDDDVVYDIAIDDSSPKDVVKEEEDDDEEEEEVQIDDDDDDDDDDDKKATNKTRRKKRSLARGADRSPHLRRATHVVTSATSSLLPQLRISIRRELTRRRADEALRRHANGAKICIVTRDWLRECVRQHADLDESDFVVSVEQDSPQL
eukprot:TRINITY_DN2275_c0_g2_i2.p1 TRINITY_DN2275_c0_g2~~TRINITY_DN2275_c0_g2_i2.p1  ORF type:complete len:262 (-),score=110.41 TRINITY_DN2275_c0_g2_i2:146-931(-)